MAAYTITTTPVEEAGLTAAVAAVNTDIDTHNAAALAADPKAAQEPHLSNTDYLLARVREVLKSYALSHKESIAGGVLNTYPTLPVANQRAILEALGMADYEALPVPKQVEALASIGMKVFLEMPPDQQNQVFALVPTGGSQ